MTPRIVVIDNDQGSRDMFDMFLTDEGWDVSTFVYALLDTATVQAVDPALIILDLNVVQAGAGWNFLQMLKMDPTTAAIPVLICTTGTTLALDIEGYLASHNIGIVHKPFDIDLIILTIRHLLMVVSPLKLPILVVEDSEELRESITMILRMEGYSVVTAANGKMALNVVQHAQFALILLDMMMPVMTGQEFLIAYEALPGIHNPVLIWTGTPQHLLAALPDFVMGRLSKPFNYEALLAAVSKYAVTA
jgi:CheY-like chemotaxis protein